MPQKKPEVSYLKIGPDENGQRLDNWLMARLKGVPRSLVYRIIRSGEVRINKGRVKASTRVATGDSVRIPPVTQREQVAGEIPQRMLVELRPCLLYQHEDILLLNKPAGMAVHSGSGIQTGLIDVARELWGQEWQLVHRLDRETSGCLLLVRRRELQHAFQNEQAERRIAKHYQAVVHGQWPAKLQRIESELARASDDSGERRVASGEGGKLAVSYFDLDLSLRDASLLNIRIETGRTHQIRVQAAEAGHPLVGDGKYGRREFDRGLKLPQRPSLCLHARSLRLSLPGHDIDVSCPMPASMQAVVDALQVNHTGECSE
ncbi:MAG: RluA family pseudouridine synthase [Oceanococcus sp.]